MRTMLISATLLMVTCAAVAQCKPAEEKQISETRDSWASNWNGKRLDSVAKLYASDAVFSSIRWNACDRSERNSSLLGENDRL